MLTLIYFVLILGLVVFIHEFGHFLVAKKCGVHCYEFSLGMGPKLFSFNRKNDETTYSLRLFPIGGYVQMAGEEIEEVDSVPKEKQLVGKPAGQKICIVLAGIFNNFVLGLLLLFLMALIYGGTDSKPYVDSATPEYSAYKAGMRDGDLIKKMNGKKVKSTDDVLVMFELIKEGESVNFTLEDASGKVKEITVKPTEEDGSYIYGISLNGKETHGFVNAVKYSFTKFASIIRTMFKIIGGLFTGRLGLNNFSGPVGIYTVVGEQAKAGFQNIIYFTAYISINVGFVNLMPIPAFDGGRAFFLIIEKIRKKPMNQKVENTIHTIGFCILMLLIVIITINDIIKLF